MTLERSTSGPCNPSDDYVTQFPWRPVGSLFDIHAVLGAAELGAATVKALAANGLGQAAIFYPENGTVATEFRFYSDGAAADEAATVEVYGASGDDYYRRIAQLTVTIGAGQKSSATVLFADTIAEAVKVWLSTTIPVSPADNTMASWGLNMHGIDRIAFLASAATMDLDPAVAGTADDTLYIEARRF